MSINTEISNRFFKNFYIFLKHIYYLFWHVTIWLADGQSIVHMDFEEIDTQIRSRISSVNEIAYSKCSATKWEESSRN